MYPPSELAFKAFHLFRSREFDISCKTLKNQEILAAVVENEGELAARKPVYKGTQPIPLGVMFVQYPENPFMI